jgi:hypothetical protein
VKNDKDRAEGGEGEQDCEWEGQDAGRTKVVRIQRNEHEHSFGIMQRLVRTGFSRVGHDKLWSEDLDLVLVDLHLHDRPRGRRVRGHENVALADERERRLHVVRRRPSGGSAR